MDTDRNVAEGAAQGCDVDECPACQRERCKTTYLAKREPWIVACEDCDWQAYHWTKADAQAAARVHTECHATCPTCHGPIDGGGPTWIRPDAEFLERFRRAGD